MDSLTQIVLGAAVAEAVAGSKMGNKAALWGAIAGTIPDLDVFLMPFFHPIDAALVHRGFSHSLIFAILSAPIFGYLTYRFYKCKYDLKTWTTLFFFSIVTHPLLDIFTNYGTEFLWPFSLRITFNSIFVIDPIYTIPFMVFLIIALFLKKDSLWRKKWNRIGLICSTTYLLLTLIIKLLILNQSTNYFAKASIHVHNPMVTPMPLTGFYWMILAEDEKNYYIGYKSIFYPFQANEIDTIIKNKKPIISGHWKGKNYSKTIEKLTNNYFTTQVFGDTILVYDLRFGLTSQLTNKKLKSPIMGYQLEMKNKMIENVHQFRSKDMMKYVNFDVYLSKIFKK